MTDEPRHAFSVLLREVDKFGSAFLFRLLQDVARLPSDNPVRIIWDKVDLASMPPREALEILPHMPSLPVQRGRPKGTGKFAAEESRIMGEILRIADTDPEKPFSELVVSACQNLGIAMQGGRKDTIDYVRKLARK